MINDPNRATGRTTRTLEAALHKMLNEGQSVLVLINSPREMDNMLDLIIHKIGIKPTKINMSQRWAEFSGHRMYFKSKDFPDHVRGYKVENIFIDHHFYEGLCWQDWEWLFMQLR